MKVLLLKNWPMLLILLFAAVVLLYKINQPFWGHHDFNNTYYGNMARNLLRYPIWETKLGQVENSGFVSPKEFSFHTHHPPLLIWSIAISYWLFGISEISTRLVPTFFSVGTVAVFFLIGEKLFNLRIACLSALFWIISPLYIYFGKMAVQEILVLFFFIFFFYSYLAKKHQLMYISSVLGMLSGWPGFYFPFVINIYDFLKLRIVRREIVYLAALAIIIFLVLLGNNLILTGKIFGGGIDQAFSFRVSGVPLLPYIRTEISRLSAYFTKPIFILAVVGFIYGTLFRKNLIFPILLLFALIHLVVFPEAVERHDYLIYYFLPVVALSSAFFLDQIFPAPKLLLLTSAAVIIISALVGGPFTKALLNSTYNWRGYVVGKLIAKNTFPNDKILVADPDILDNSEVQVVFYADRSITTVSSAFDLKGYDYFVTRKNSQSYQIQKVSK